MNDALILAKLVMFLSTVVKHIHSYQDMKLVLAAVIFVIFRLFSFYCVFHYDIQSVIS